jgi:anti-sigma-K factor RskA
VTGANIVPLRESDFGSWLMWVPWALAACFALLCIILLGTSASLRRQIADLRQNIEQISAASTESEQQRQELQTVIQQVTNYQQRIVELQTQVAQRNQEYQRDVTRLEDQLKQGTRQAQAERVQLNRQINEQQTLIDELKDTISQATAATSDRFAQTRIFALLPNPQSNLQAVGAAAFDTSAQQGVIVIQNLQPLPASQDYQLWLIDPRFSSPVSGGVFGPDARGQARYQFQANLAIEAVGGFAVSIERKGGVALPTGDAIIMRSN